MAEATFVHGNPLMVDHTPGSDVSAGEVVVLTDAVRISHKDIASGMLGALAAGGGVYETAKATGGGTAFTDGDTAYWDDTNNQATNSDGGGANKKLGLAVAAAGDSDASVLVQHVPN